MIALVVLFVLSLCCNAVLGVFAVRSARFMIRYEDSIEDALDEIDVAYAEMSDLLNKPVVSDSPEIRSLVTRIKSARERFLRAAQKIAMQERDTSE